MLMNNRDRLTGYIIFLDELKHYDKDMFVSNVLTILGSGFTISHTTAVWLGVPFFIFFSGGNS